MEDTHNSETPADILKQSSPEVQMVIKHVLRLERDHLHSDRPRVIDDIVAIVKQSVSDLEDGK